MTFHTDIVVNDNYSFNIQQRTGEQCRIAKYCAVYSYFLAPRSRPEPKSSDL